MGSTSSGSANPAIAILVPLTGPRANIGQVLVQAAQLALQDPGSPRLDVLDTTGTPQGAATAAQTAIANRDAIILGPLSSTETGAVTPIAQRANIPVLAFTNDGSKSRPGIWVLGITPAQQVRRLVAVAQDQGKTRFAALLPGGDFGQALGSALSQAVTGAGLPPPTISMHGGGMASITSGTRRVTDYADRRGPIDAKIKAARELGTPEGRREAQDLSKSAIPPAPFDALLLADTGESLQEIVSLLPYYDVDVGSVQIMGPALWASHSSGSGVFPNAWYAAPDASARASFVQDFTAKNGDAPPGVADLAYDGAQVARQVASQRGGIQTALEQPNGFIGSDGWFALLPDGHVQRGLAVFRVRGGGTEVVDPAPQSSGSPGL
jgi:branched-chain amino acid transport system substrate-binding protein